MNIEQLSINAIRALAIDGINKAKSGHPGMALGSAPILYTLFTKHIVTDPNNPDLETLIPLKNANFQTLGKNYNHASCAVTGWQFNDDYFTTGMITLNGGSANGSNTFVIELKPITF